MGGPGSGRRYQFGAPTLEGFQRVDTSDIPDHRTLRPGERIRIEAWREGHCEEHIVSLSFTPCHFGGQRAWFNCPWCLRRVGSLFYGSWGLRCRHCLGLRHASSQESKQDRAWRRYHKLRRRLLGSQPDTGQTPAKPPRMHWQTYRRLLGAMEEAEMDTLQFLLHFLSRQRALRQTVRDPKFENQSR